ncbi:hypothetical protein LSTR_LSTR007585 [Laodelphax striatellus]|uniref:Uncharacterized protein n=1 Tax=Laodelphax striatellus TaxID=195883 RepID=A0A482WHP1_LAOST|nr:hypothetical protein LSTR_LSTR007585 [Laodelphax striatellus]
MLCFIQVLLLISCISCTWQAAIKVERWQQIHAKHDQGDAIILLILDRSHDEEIQKRNIEAFNYKCKQYPDIQCFYGFQTESKLGEDFSFVEAHVAPENLPIMVFFKNAAQQYLLEPEADGYLNDDQIKRAAEGISSRRPN